MKGDRRAGLGADGLYGNLTGQRNGGSDAYGAKIIERKKRKDYLSGEVTDTASYFFTATINPVAQFCFVNTKSFLASKYSSNFMAFS